MAAADALPVQATPLVGRDRDARVASDVLMGADCRLLTLVGMGGIGKTRLALAVAEAVRDRFAGGLCFVDLTATSDPAVVPSLLAAQLHVRAESHVALEYVKEYLYPREILLVLDNFEHVLSSAMLVAEILEVCSRVKVLATSREPLHLRWEQRLVVEGLEVPDLEHLPPPEELGEVPAVALFLQRARAVNLRFEASEATLRDIAELCVRLEGVPLAIELAASRSNMLSPGTMLNHLDQRLALLRSHARDAPRRHQSLQTTLEWSYQLLLRQEQAVFRRLGVFVDGSSLEAVQAIMEADVESVDTLDALSSLADKALVISQPAAAGGASFRQLETARLYAEEMLRRAGELEAARASHARYYCSLAECESTGLRYASVFVFVPPGHRSAAHESGPWPAALDRDWANINAALQWTYEQGEHEMLLRFAVSLGRYWWLRRLLRDGIHWLELALERNPNADASLKSKALAELGVMYRQQGDFEHAYVLLDSAVASSRTVGDSELLATQLIDLANVLGNLGRFADASTFADESAALSRAGGDDWAVAVALSSLGTRDFMTGQPVSGESLLTESLALFRDVGDMRAVTLIEALIARAVAMQGDGYRALPHLEAALERSQQLGSDVWLATIIEIAASVLCDAGSPQTCARLLGAGDALRIQGQRRVVFEQQIYDACISVLSATLDNDTLSSALEAGRQMEGKEAIEEARDLLHSHSSEPQSRKARRSRERGLFSEREVEVLTLLVEGNGNKTIGRRLDISENTVKFHVASILKKLGVSSRVEAVTAAIDRDLL